MFLKQNDAAKKECFEKLNGDPNSNSKDLDTRKTNNENLKQCSPVHAGCEYKFYYEKKIEGEEYYNSDGQDDKDEVFIFFRQIQDTEDINQNEWVPQIKCSEIPLAELIGVAGGKKYIYIYI